MRMGVVCLLLTLVSRPAVADQAWGLAVDSKGRVYVVVDPTTQHAKLLRVDPDRTKVVLDEKAFIREVRLDKDDVPSVIRIARGLESGELLTVGRKGNPRTLL